MKIHWLCAICRILLMNCLIYCSSLILWFPRIRYSFWMSKKCLEILPSIKFFQPMISWLLARFAICGDMHPISVMFLVPRISTYLGIQYAGSLSVFLYLNNHFCKSSVDSRNNLFCPHLDRDKGELMFLPAHNWGIRPASLGALCSRILVVLCHRTLYVAWTTISCGHLASSLGQHPNVPVHLIKVFW